MKMTWSGEGCLSEGPKKGDPTASIRWLAGKCQVVRGNLGHLRPETCTVWPQNNNVIDRAFAAAWISRQGWRRVKVTLYSPGIPVKLDTFNSTAEGFIKCSKSIEPQRVQVSGRRKDLAGLTRLIFWAAYKVSDGQRTGKDGGDISITYLAGKESSLADECQQWWYPAESSSRERGCGEESRPVPSWSTTHAVVPEGDCWQHKTIWRYRSKIPQREGSGCVLHSKRVKHIDLKDYTAPGTYLIFR